MFKSVEQFFLEEPYGFTVFVVEQKFAVSRGREFFDAYRNSDNFIDSSKKADTFIKKILKWIGKAIPPIAELIQMIFFDKTVDLPLAINSLFKIFSAHEHQAAGPEVIDPIIIQEGSVKKSQIGQIVSLHKQSILRPRIIFILKDNDFSRAKNLLGFCPNGTSVKFIRNSGEEKNDIILNTGAENVNQFLEIFSKQCFNSCSHTETGIIYNKEWAEDSIIKLWGPSLMKFRTMLLYGEKADALDGISTLIKEFEVFERKDKRNKDIVLGLECMAKLFRVFCNDFGGEDIIQASKLASHLENELLSAHVYRYSFFMDGVSDQIKSEMLVNAQHIFSKNNIEDHSIYCENNLLMKTFYEETVSPVRFMNMLERAVHNVPGLVGMPILYNNTGVSFLYESRFEEAIESFEKGLRYNPQIDHRLGLMTNILIAKSLSGENIFEEDLIKVLNLALTNLGEEKLPFLTANFAVNVFSISLKNKDLFIHLNESYDIKKLLHNALHNSSLGRSSLSYQLNRLKALHKEFSIPIEIPPKVTPPKGIRKRYIEVTGLNPSIFSAWL